MRNAFDKFEAAGLKVYAVSYDDQEVLSEYAEKQEFPFPLLSDLDSEVIRRYGILNEQIGPDDGFYYGIPYPGVFVTDEAGIVVALQVWSHTVDVKIPIYPIGELVSEVRPLDQKSVQIEIKVRYQACDDTTCLLPRTEALTLELPLEAVDVPAISVHTGHGQREGNYDGTRHMKRLLKRKGDSGNLITPPTDD